MAKFKQYINGAWTTISETFPVLVGKVPILISKSISANGTYSAEDDNADGYSSVTINVPTSEEPTLISKNINENGTYNASDDSADGYDTVTVNVPTGTARSDSDVTVSGATVTVPAGLYSSGVSKSVASGSVTLNTPTVNSSGLVTASATVNTGYISGSPANKTLQLTTQAAATITPNDNQQTAVSSGKYTTGNVVVAPVPSATYIKRSEVVTYHVVSSTPTPIYNDGDLIFKVVT